MVDANNEYIDPHLAEIEQEFLAAGKLHSLLEQRLDQVGPYSNTREIGDDGEEYFTPREAESIPVREGWRMNILDGEMAKDIRNRYWDKPVKPIYLVFWPDVINSISNQQYYYDGPKIRLVVCPNGIFDEQTNKWLASAEVKALLADLKDLMQ